MMLMKSRKGQMTVTKGQLWGLIGVIGAIGLLIGFGGSQTLTKDQLDNAYYCSMTDNVGIFERLSDSKKTAYYTNVDGEEISVPCRVGRVYAEYVKVIDYAVELGVDPNLLLQSFLSKEEEITPEGEPTPVTPNTGVQERCYTIPRVCYLMG